MAEKLKGNMLIAQSGGPTVVINQSLVGAIIEAKKHNEIKGIYGSLNGIKGVMEERLIDLKKEPSSVLKKVAYTPCAALGSVRKKPSEQDCEVIFKMLQKYNVRYFFYIGGNDSAETANILNESAKRVNYEFRCFHIPKTIDNDLLENDHTPGYGSAAKFVAMAVMGDNLDNISLPGVKIDVIMGRHAGFLVAASSLARIYEGDGPHLIYFPERSFSKEQFMKDVESVYSKYGRCLVTVSEGISDENGEPIASKFIKEVDAHGNVQLSGTGALGDLLANFVRDELKISRVRADTFGYLQRSFPAIYSDVDAKEAYQVGVLAVRYATSGKLESGSVSIKRKKGKKYEVYFEPVELTKVAKETRSMPNEFINEDGNDVTKAFIDYAKPLVGKLPEIGVLKKYPVKG
ncbi:MAG: 6-phosphofructokinase [Candidatus Omnitrophica bacterium]|nr:6-phosphofructokinase [Candidatus Omnitrophota bacterium]MCM8777063.1 6-phosphofructokinase [Candidatus Omnitrophota bacterium]